MSGTRFLPEALIRSNMSCQIRGLINHGREQSSPLTDGEMEAGHFFSTSLTFSSAFNRKQNKSGLVSVAEAQIQQPPSIPAVVLTRSLQVKRFSDPPLRRQTSVLMLLFNVLHKFM